MTTSFMPIAPLSYFFQQTQQEWWPDMFTAYRQPLNPRNEPFIDELQSIRYNLMRAVLRFRDYQPHWRAIGGIQEAIEEHRAESFESLYRTFFALEMLEETQHAITDGATLLDSLMHNPTAMAEITSITRATNRMESTVARIIESMDLKTADDLESGIKLAGLAYTMGARTWPLVNQAELALRHPGKFTHSPLLLQRPINEQSRIFYAKWADEVGPFQWDMLNSTDMMLADCHLSSFINNRLDGAAARNGRVLLVDGGIPLPNMASFLGWWQAAGVVLRKLTEHERKWYAPLRHDASEPTHIMTYCPPMMPRTSEHANRSVIQTDDSHADHSLSIRSNGHRRDSHLALHYGVRRCRTVLLDSHSGAVYVVADDHNPQSFLTKTAMGVHHAHGYMLPVFNPSQVIYLRGDVDSLDPFLPHLGPDAYSTIQGVLPDPYAADTQALEFFRITSLSPVDVGWRSLSKWGTMHFRFDDNEIADSWCDEFEQIAIRHMNATPWEMAQYYMQAALRMTIKTNAPEREVKKTKKGIMTFAWDDSQ